jgi:rhodanese-related sulfurtransferase
VAVVGLAMALAANQLSPRGLSLSRNYFPGGGKPIPKVEASTNGVPSSQGTNQVASGAPETLAARLQAKGLKPIEREAAVQAFRDPRYEAELIVFVDARDDQHYQEGHVPGAYQFDHYRPESYLPAVLPACQNAERIVVYCNGGNCEDSEFAALTLKANGVSLERLFVYAGGMTEWATNGLPVEIGTRKSGNLRNAKP